MDLFAVPCDQRNIYLKISRIFKQINKALVTKQVCLCIWQLLALLKVRKRFDKKEKRNKLFDTHPTPWEKTKINFFVVTYFPQCDVKLNKTIKDGGSTAPQNC